MSEIKELFSNRKTVISAVIVIILILGLAVGLYLIKNPQIFKSRATEKKEAKQEEQKDQYVKGEVLVKFKASISKFKVKPGKEDKDLDREAVSISELDETTLPQQFQSLNQKYQIQKIEKVFKGVGTPQEEINKFKQKFSQELSQGKRKINESELLKIDLSRTYKLSFNQDAPVESIIQELSQNPEVEYAEPNFIFQIQQTESTPSAFPNDPYFQDPETLAAERNLSYQEGGWNPQDKNSQPLSYQWDLKKIGFPQAWQHASPSATVTVAVVDTGVDYNHPDLQAKLWENQGEIGLDKKGRDKKTNRVDDDKNGYIDDFRGWDSTDYYWGCDFWGCDGHKPADNDPMDDAYEPYSDTPGGGHGTHVTGTITANINNGVGISGMNNSVKVMALRGLRADGGGYTSQLIQLINYAVMNGAIVINMSWGSSFPSQSLEEVLYSAYENGVVLVAAAGNGGEEGAIYPAAYPQVIAVSATNENDQLTSYSNYGEKIEVAAPGGDGHYGQNPRSILSLRANNTDGYCGSDYNCIGRRINHTEMVAGATKEYYRSAGTSMASPHVAGLASLLLSKNPNLTPDQVRSIIGYSADDLGDPGKDNKYGYGRINVYKALKEYSANPPPVAFIADPYGLEHLYSGTFDVKGTATSGQFQSFRLEYAPADNTTSWSSDRISLKPAGTIGIENDVLVTWDSANLEGNYILRLTTADREGRERSYQTTVQLVNQSIKPGWPIKYDSLRTNPIIADLDNDGKKEIIVSQLDKIIAYKENGEIMSGWPVLLTDKICGYIGTYYCYYRNSTIVVGNIDPNSSGKEVISSELAGSLPYNVSSKLKIIRADGTIASTLDNISSAGVTADVNGDGIDEILSITTNNTGSDMTWMLHAYNINGQELTNFPVQFHQGYGSINTYISNIRVGDINGDSKEDVVIVISAANRDGANTLIAISGTGQVLWQKSLHTGYAGYYNYAPFVLADLDSDNKKEVIFYETYSLSESPWYAYDLYILKGDGTNFISNIPLNLFDISGASIHVADVDNDKQPEIILVSNEKVAVIEKDGRVTTNNLPSDLKMKPVGDNVIGDLDNNGSKEFFSFGQVDMMQGNWPTTYNSMAGIFEFSNNNFTEKSGWPKSIIADMWALGGNGNAYNPAIGDLDDDGKAELILQYCLRRKDSCYLYVLKQNSQSGVLDWSQFAHDERHTGTYSLPSPSPTPFVCAACKADIVKDPRNRVDSRDYAVLSSCFGKPPSTVLSGGRSCATADIKPDGTINQEDVDCLRSVYFQTCTATGSAAQR